MRRPYTRYTTKKLIRCLQLLRRYNVFTCRTLGPHALGAVVSLVPNKDPRFRYDLTTFRTVTEGRFISVHEKGWKERVTVFLLNELPPGFNVSLWRLCGSKAPDFRWIQITSNIKSQSQKRRNP